jgi:CRISPR system Cascade subunit CasA
MQLNLLERPWIPVRLLDGRRTKVRPAQLSGADIAAFDAVRADFNGALAQFAISLLQTAAPVDSDIEWRQLWQQPPDEHTLNEWFAAFSPVFDLDGDGPRFMQDHELRMSDADPVSIGNLLIETPGENALRNNSDHFVKRGLVGGLCPDCAAAALFTLQVNAPSGGAGHRTGLRGGGPLTTLLVTDAPRSGSVSLWKSLWLNVRRCGEFAPDGGPDPREFHRAFPWCRPLSAIQKDGGQTTPAQTHPAHVFWAMPRRIRLDLNQGPQGRCDLCDEVCDHLVERYVTRNYGFNYKGPWRHPLSPYYETKEGWLSLHPQPDGLGYKHWLGWVLGVQSDKRRVEPAPAIGRFSKADAERRLGIGLRMWAFGYDMDNMKARGWHEATVPLYALADGSPAAQKAVREDVAAWLAGADLAASYLRGAVKHAWFGTKAAGDLGFVDAAFWSGTQADFYTLLGEHIAATQQGTTLERTAAAERWLAQLRRAVLRLFDDELVGPAAIERTNPARAAAAHQQLGANLNGPKLRAALSLPDVVKPSTARSKPKGVKQQGGAQQAASE